MLFLHGLWMSGIEAQLFRNRLESHHGLRTHVFRYATHHETMAVVLERLAGVVAELQATQLHLVGHSLGGVITLRFLEAQAASLPPGRVVLLAAPVQGSLAATRMEHFGTQPGGAAGLRGTRRPARAALERRARARRDRR